MDTNIVPRCVNQQQQVIICLAHFNVMSSDFVFGPMDISTRAILSFSYFVLIAAFLYRRCSI